jgi:hypothetical protein
MLIKLRNLNRLGVTIIELLVYVSLLSMLATVMFSFVWQIHHKNKKILNLHADLHVSQMAIDLLSCDLRNSKMVITDKKKSANLICQKSSGIVSWYLNQEQTLLRLDQQAKIKKPVPAKVAENLKELQVQQIKLKSGAILIKLKLVDVQQNMFKKTVLLRASMPI